MTKEMKEAWYEMMKAKYNTDEEGVREIMRQRQQKGLEKRRATGKFGGFSEMDKERLIEVSRKGGAARHGKKD